MYKYRRIRLYRNHRVAFPCPDFWHRTSSAGLYLWVNITNVERNFWLNTRQCYCIPFIHKVIFRKDSLKERKMMYGKTISVLARMLIPTELTRVAQPVELPWTCICTVMYVSALHTTAVKACSDWFTTFPLQHETLVISSTKWSPSWKLHVSSQSKPLRVMPFHA